MSGIEEAALLASVAPEMMGAGAAATALPAAGMAATGGLLGTGASAFAGADALAGLGLGAEGLGGGMGAAMSAGLPASAAPFTASAMPSMMGSFGLGDATAYGMANPLTMGDKMGMFAQNMMPSKQQLMLNGMKMAGQSMTQQPQQHAAPMPNLQAQQYQPLTAGNSSEEYRKKRDELLKRMLGMQ